MRAWHSPHGSLQGWVSSRLECPHSRTTDLPIICLCTFRLNDGLPRAGGRRARLVPRGSPRDLHVAMESGERARTRNRPAQQPVFPGRKPREYAFCSFRVQPFCARKVACQVRLGHLRCMCSVCLLLMCSNESVHRQTRNQNLSFPDPVHPCKTQLLGHTMTQKPPVGVVNWVYQLARGRLDIRKSRRKLGCVLYMGATCAWVVMVL